MVFNIGSISKQFTAAGLLRLVEQGKIHLTDSIQQYIRDYPWKGHRITIENLLTHTSGIVDYMSLDDPDPYAERKDWKPDQLIHYFDGLPLQFEPGTKYSYTNSGYTILAYIIQTVTGIPFHTYMKDSVLSLAGLTHTGYADAMTVVPGLVQGYTRNLGYYQNAEYLSMTLAYGAGDLHSTSEDLLRWNCALLAGKVVSPANLKKAWTSFRLPDGTNTHYGYAWFVDSLAGEPCIHHEGQINGFISMEKYFPVEDLYVCTMTNVLSGEDTTSFSRDRYNLMQEVAEAALGKLVKTGVDLPEAVLDRYVGTYVSAGNPKQKVIIYKEKGHLYADLSNRTGMHMVLVPMDSTKFILPDVVRIKTTVEFTFTAGKVDGGIWVQEKPYKFVRVN